MNIDEDESDVQSESEYDSDDYYTTESSSSSSSSSLSSDESASDHDSYKSTHSSSNSITPFFNFFKFERVKYANQNAPSKRSGHRAVCNNDSMWIWGGFCPVEGPTENNAEPRFPLFKEVNIETRNIRS